MRELHSSARPGLKFQVYGRLELLIAILSSCHGSRRRRYQLHQQQQQRLTTATAVAR